MRFLSLSLSGWLVVGGCASASPSTTGGDGGRLHVDAEAGMHHPDSSALRDAHKSASEAGTADARSSHDASPSGDGQANNDSGAQDAGRAAPAQAAAVGYTVNTFSSTLARSSVDTGNTQATGYEWYLGQFFGSPPTPASDLTFNADGTLTLDGAGTTSNAGLNSATRSTNAAGWVGVAFGGGAYFEATFHFNPQDTINANGHGWPSWWAMAIEHDVSLPAQQWPGQPAQYDHFIETDFFEYDVWSFSPHYEYGGAMHDWYGIYESTCAGGYCNVSNSGGGGTSFSNFQVQTPTTTDFTQYHAFGYLWVPATSSQQGYGQYYFDGVATNDKVTWSEYSGSDTPPPGTAPWTFGILDQQHLALVLGTGPNEPMTIKSVDVWQTSAAHNLSE